MAVNFNDAIPAAPESGSPPEPTGINIHWQWDGEGNASAYVALADLIGIGLLVPGGVPVLGDVVMWTGSPPSWQAAALVGQNHSDDEIPAGTFGGSPPNTEFTLAHMPNPMASLQLFRNGVLQLQGTASPPTGDYYLCELGSPPAPTIVFFTAPLGPEGSPPDGGDWLRAWYRY
jgi:hypothetical protein